MMRMRRGFTLLEVMVAVFIFLIFVSAVYGVYSAANAAMTRAEESEEVYQTGRVVLAQLSAELASAYQPVSAPDSRLIGEETAGSTALPADTLTFLTTAHRTRADEPIGDLCQVRYTVGDEATGETSGLYLTEWLHPDLEGTTEEPEAQLLAARVVRFHCRYLPAEEGSDWVDDWVDQTTLPQAVRIELTVRPRNPEAKPVALVTTVNLMMATAPATGGADAEP